MWFLVWLMVFGIPVYKYAKGWKKSQPPKGKFIRINLGVYFIGLNLSVSNEFLNIKVTELSSFTFID